MAKAPTTEIEAAAKKPVARKKAATEAAAPVATLSSGTNIVGQISQVIGAVIDVTFPDRLPAILSALETDNNGQRSEEHTSALQSLMRISYAVLCLQTKTN